MTRNVLLIRSDQLDFFDNQAGESAMPDTAKRQDIVDAVQEGILEASALWSRMTGEWLWVAPEHFVSNLVAQRIYKVLSDRTGGWVALEWQVRRTLEDALTKPLRGRPHGRLRKNGRSDIVVFRKDGLPRGAVEIKHRYNSFASTLESDIERLIQVVRTRGDGSTVPLGIMGLYLEVGDPERRYGDARDRWLKTSKRIVQEAKKHLAAHKFKEGISLRGQCSEPSVDDGGACGSVCLVYWRTKKRTAAAS